MVNSNTPGKREIDSELKTLGKNLKCLREACNLSLDVLSSKTNISVKVLADMENGADFEARFLVYLSDFYEVSPSNLFSESFIQDFPE